MTRILTIATSLLLFAICAQAQNLYKWVDEDGNVTYQDSPPPGDTGDAQPFAEDVEVAAEAEADALPDVLVTLYSIPVCDACDLVRNLLEKHGVPFTEKDANEDASVQDEIKDLAGQLSVPVLAIGDSVISGYSSTGITAELTNAGFEPGEPSGAATAEPGAGLTEEEVARQAVEAAAELTADLDELATDPRFLEEPVEEIPEEEQIKIQTGQ